MTAFPFFLYLSTCLTVASMVSNLSIMPSPPFQISCKACLKCCTPKPASISSLFLSSTAAFFLENLLYSPSISIQSSARSQRQECFSGSEMDSLGCRVSERKRWHSSGRDSGRYYEGNRELWVGRVGRCGGDGWEWFYRVELGSFVDLRLVASCMCIKLQYWFAVMNSKYNVGQLNRLKSILFPTQPHTRTFSSVSPSSSASPNKQNQSHNTTNCMAPSLKAEMSRLKSQVQVMINRDEQLNSTTRHYLERIRKMSEDLPEEIECLKEAGQSLIGSLPERRGKVVREGVGARAVGRVLEGVLARGVRRVLQSAWARMERCKVRSKGEVGKGVVELRRVMMMASGFNRWRSNMLEQSLSQQYEANSQGLDSLCGLLDHFLNQPSLLIQLTNLVRDQADFAQVLIYDKRTSKLFTYLQKYSGISNSHIQSVSTIYQRMRTGQSQTSQIKRYQLQLQDSLTKMCICRKQILRLERIEQDRDYAGCDAMLCQQLESFRPLSLGAVFLPLVNAAKEVVGLLRLYYVEAIHADIDVRIAEFLGGVIDASRGLGHRVKEIRLHKREEKSQLYCKLLPILKLIEAAETREQLFKNLWESLSSFLHLSSLTVLKHTQSSLVKLYSSSPDPDLKHLLPCLKLLQTQPTVQVNNSTVIRVGSQQIMGLVELGQPIEVNALAMDMLFRLVIRREAELAEAEKVAKERQVMRKERESKERRDRYKQKVKDVCRRVLGCETMEQLFKQFQQLIKEYQSPIPFAQLFLNNSQCFFSLPAKIYPLSDPFMHRLLKSKKLFLSPLDEHFNQLSSFIVTTPLYTKDLLLFNVTVQIDSQTKYLMSVGVESAEGDWAEDIIEGLESFAESLKAIERFKRRPQDKELEVVTEGLGAWGNDPAQVVENVFKTALNRECRVVQYKYDSVVYKGEAIQLEAKALFERAIKQTYVKLPEISELALPIENIELNQQLFRLSLQQNKEYRDQLQTLGRIFGVRLQKFTIITVTNKERIMFVVFEGFPQVSIETVIQIATSAYKQQSQYCQQLQKVHLITKLNSLFSTIEQIQRRQIALSYFKIKKPQRKTLPKQLNLGVLEFVYCRTLKTALHAIQGHSIQNKYTKQKKYSYTNLQQLLQRLQQSYTSTISCSFSRLLSFTTSLTRKQTSALSLTHTLSTLLSNTYSRCFSLLRTHHCPRTFPRILNTVVHNRLSDCLSLIRSCRKHTINETFLSSFCYEPTLKSLTKIFMKVAEIQGFEFALQRQARRVTWSKVKGLRVIGTATEVAAKGCLRVDMGRFDVLWIYADKEALTLESKQYLQMVSKAVSDNLQSLQSRLNPLFSLLNTLHRKHLNRLKSCSLNRWRLQLLRDFKLLQYSHIQKAYRLNQQLSSLTELRHKRRTEYKRKCEQLATGRKCIEESTECMQREREQIDKIDKVVRANEVAMRLAQVLGGRRRVRDLWQRWRAMRQGDRQQEGFERERARHVRAMLQAAANTIQRTVRKYHRKMKNQSFKILTINFVKSRELSNNQNSKFQQSKFQNSKIQYSKLSNKQSSPIKNPCYLSLMQQCQLTTQTQHLLIQHFDQPSKLSTYSKIQPIVVARTVSPGSIRLNRNIKYISQNSNIPNTPSAHHAPYTPSSVPHRDSTPSKLNNSCMGNIRERMLIHSQHEQARSLSNHMGYQLSNQTMRFLRKFGREGSASGVSPVNRSDYN